MKTMSHAVAASVALALITSASASAQSIEILNPSFELPAMSPGGFTSTAPDGWRHGGVGTIGVFYPTVASWGYTASHGNQVGYTNGGIIEQTLSETLRVGVPYTLLVDVVHRPSFFQTYRIELLAGDTVIAVDDGQLSPPRASHLTSAIGYQAAPGDPLLGQQLKIRLSGPSQANFDDVRITTCWADLDGDGALTFFDFLTFQDLFAAGDLRADFSPDGRLDFFDFLAFQDAFAAGCV
jgi:hypothetical protein